MRNILDFGQFESLNEENVASFAAAGAASVGSSIIAKANRFKRKKLMNLWKNGI